MNERSQLDDVRKVVEAVALLPPEKRDFILGYSQGVIDARNREQKRKEETPCRP